MQAKATEFGLVVKTNEEFLAILESAGADADG